MSLKRKKVLLRILILVLALIISFLYGFQHLLWLHDLQWDSKNTVFITSFEAWDSDHYLAKIKEIYEGNFKLSNAYLAEYKNTVRSPWPKLPYYLSVFIGKLFHLDVQYLAVCMDFFLPPIIFFLAYLFFSTLSTSPGISVLGAFIFTLTPNITRFEVFPLVIFRLLRSGLTAPVLTEAYRGYGFSRIINPQLTFIFLLGTLLFFFKGIITSKNRYFLLAILFGTITSYSYVYFSTYLYVFLGIYAVGAFLLKEKHLCSRSLLVLGSILVLSLPFWYSIFSLSDSTLHQMAWMEKRHSPIIDFQVLLTILICLFIVGGLLIHLVSKHIGVICLSLLLSGIICLNQHVLTGIHVQSHHYLLYVIPQSMFFALFLAGIDGVKRCRNIPYSLKSSLVFYGGICLGGGSMVLRPSFVKSYLSPDGTLTPEFTSFFERFHLYGLFLGLSLVLLGILLKTQRYTWVTGLQSRLTKCYHSLQLHRWVGTILYILILGYVPWDIGVGRYQQYQEELKPQFEYLQKLAPSLHWLNEHTERESVIVSNPYIYSTASIVTIYTHNNVYVSEYAQYYTVPSMSEIQDRLYNLLYFMGITSQEDFQKFMRGIHVSGSFSEYQEKLKREFYSELKKYRADYLFYGPKERQYFNVEPETYTFLKEVYTDSDVIIYQIL